MFRLKPVEALLERAAARKNQRERVLVERPWKARALFIRSVLTFVAVLGLWVFYAFAGTGPSGWPGVVYAVAGVVLGFWIGANALAGMARAVAYRSGWLDGRAAMVDAMRDARSPEEWLRTQMHHDLNVLGVPPDDWPAL